MTGRASAELICKAKVTKPAIFPARTTYEGYCGNVIRPDLRFDLSRDAYVFDTPSDWHVEVGVTPDKTIVRCPEHCSFIRMDVQYPGQGQWQDAP